MHHSSNHLHRDRCWLPRSNSKRSSPCHRNHSTQPTPSKIFKCLENLVASTHRSRTLLTYTYLAGRTMEEVFGGEREGCYLYSRHPTHLHRTWAFGQTGKYGICTGNGTGHGCHISSIDATVWCCDHIVSSRTIYGGTYAFMKHFLPRYNVTTSFVDTNNLDAVRAAIQENTKVLYCEVLSNPFFGSGDIREMSKLAKEHNLTLVVDNTFTPMIFSPIEMGADIVIHSLTKFINGASDTVGGAVCASKEFVMSLIDVNHGAAMLLGPTMDSSTSRRYFKEHAHTARADAAAFSLNADYLAHRFEEMDLEYCIRVLKVTHNMNSLPTWGIRSLDFVMLTLDVGDMQMALQSSRSHAKCEHWLFGGESWVLSHFVQCFRCQYIL